ncbi:hypothetical protein F4677DRAFT_205841 [Hypoxylon crocopeplum]|nr:hypothetical protein F4677DRAFT_205841 [Hypoxylon crocopeplum]
MAVESLSHYFLICIIILAGSAAGIELGDDITTFVPTCAQSCLVSFIAGNYPSSDCTSNPTLQCLCAERSNSGYTLGEGALQCISAEEQRSVCTADDVGGSVKHDAYLMCSTVKNAVSNTHSVLTATIAGTADGGAGSIVLSSMPTAAPSDAVPTSPQSGTTTSLPTPTTTNTGPTATTTDGTAAPSSSPASGSLTTAQIAGIVAGVAGTILITLVAILIARCIRKRNYPDLEDGLLPMDDDRSKSAASGSKKSGRLVISPPFRRFSNPQPEPQLPQAYRTLPPHPPPPPPKPPTPLTPPIPYLSPNPNQETIGLAISRSLNTTPSTLPDVPVARPPSRLLPAKPALSLKIAPPRPPPPEPLSQPQATVTRVVSSQTPHTDRASVLTNMTGFADLDTEAPEGDQIWRPPPSDPQSATTSYVANKWGHWVLNNNSHQSEIAQVTEAAELDTYTPLTKSPIEKREEEAVAMAAAFSAATTLPERPQPAFLSEDRPNKTLNRSSSVYSQASAIRHNSRVLASRNNSSRRGNGFKITRSDTNMSHDSVTTINTSSSSPLDEEEFPLELENSRLSQLSTVMETPSPTTGRSPVKYPKIPGRFNIEPPRKPDFGSLPPGQPSPTLKGAALPSSDKESPYPQPLKPRRPQRPQIPDMDDLPKPPRLDQSRPPIQSPVSRFSPRVPNIEAPAQNSRYPERLQTPPMQTFGSGFSPNPPSIDKFPTPSPMSSRSGKDEVRPHVARAISPLSIATISSGNTGNSGASGASSLLAKRIGNDKAAALALFPGVGKKERWRRHGGQGNMLSPEDAGFSSSKGTLPNTPTWLPKLTPTRHGDDLYLNVQ